MRNLFCEDKCSPNDKWCVRRVFGALGFICFIVLIFMGSLSPNVQLLGVLSATLLGVTTIDKFVKNGHDN
jgi:hypothetical protein